jgi:glycosyltransferase involved in cell wall biosynthesis
MSPPRFSVIIPVFNRPLEVKELLESLTRQTRKVFEVIVVEDGSTLRCDTVVDEYRNRLTINYIYKPNSGPGPSRNVGYKQAMGEYFVVFDSDCILPPSYFEVVEKGLTDRHLDAWGGPDKAHQDFTIAQKAMAYTMSSVLTTGGIRGGKKHIGWFQPRSFNMGISRSVFNATGGFVFDRFAEDIEFSIRMRNHGFNVGLIPDAFVYHKRRATFVQFYKQVFNFGKGRALIGQRYPAEVKLTHWFPTVFLMGVVTMCLSLLVSINWFLVLFTGFLLYLLLLFSHALVVNKSLAVAVLSIPAALLQFFGYGAGFLKERIKPFFR